MNVILGILSLSAPLFLASTGALISEYAGCMALFLDGIINLSAFLCFAGTTLFNSALLGIIFSVLICMALVLLASFLIEKLQANVFLASLALNLLFSALTSVLSSIFFKTRGVLTSPAFLFNASQVRFTTTLLAFIICIAFLLLLTFTSQGLYIRILGKDSQVLKAKGVNIVFYRLLSQVLAALLGSIVGCIMCIRLSSFVPNIASGMGWTALAIVFLSKKNTAAIFAAVLAFALAQYGANNIQNVTAFKSIPVAFLLSLPYLSALLLILLTPQNRKKSNL